MSVEPPKPPAMRWYTYLFVAVVLSFFTVVAWPLAKEYGSARLAAKPEASPAAPEQAKPPVNAVPVAPPPRDKPPAASAELTAAPPKVAPQAEPKFRDVVIDEPFEQVFAKSKVLMDTTGVREITLPNGQFAILCVGQAKLHTDTAAGRVEAGQVCENEMAAALLAWKKGLETERKLETGEKIDLKIVTAMKGHVRILPPVGRWVSAKGDVYYVAYGKVFAPNELRP